MAKRISQLNQITRAQLAVGDLIPVVDVSAGQTKYATLSDLTGLPDFGWTATGETHTFSSWSSTYKIGVIDVPSDATVKYSPGMRYRISQSTGGTKYGIIVKVTSTTLTVFFGTDYTLNNETITSPVYSGEKYPVGFPDDPDKWSVKATDTSDRTQPGPGVNTWYNMGGFSINVPIGAWRLSGKVTFFANRPAAAGDVYVTISTSNNSESDPEFTNGTEVGANAFGAPYFVEKPIKLTSNTPYYFNTKTTTASTSNLYNFGGRSTSVLRAVSAYL